MTTKNFNAKKTLMSAVAAVVFSFVFTTSANAEPLEYKQGNNLEVRVKERPNGDSQKKQEQKQGQKQEKKQENKDVVSSMLQMFGIRVKWSAPVHQTINIAFWKLNPELFFMCHRMSWHQWYIERLQDAQSPASPFGARHLVSDLFYRVNSFTTFLPPTM